MSLYLGTNIVSGAIQDAASKSGTNTFTGTNTFSNTITGTTSGNLDTNASNATSTGKETIVDWCMPDYSSAISVSNTGSYTAPSNGILYTYVSGSSGGETWVYINSIKVGFGQYTNTGVGNFESILMRKGDTITWTTGRISNMNFIPCVGG